jgi:elongator complex protein 3
MKNQKNKEWQTREWQGFDFKAQPEEAQILPLLAAVCEMKPKNEDDWRRLFRKYPKPNGGFYSKTQLLEGARTLNQFVLPSGMTQEALLEILRAKPTRTQSGVTPVTVLTKPYPCPGKCIFCPNDVRMPKSYLSDEPGAQRAMLNRFDPYAQTWNRLLALHKMGHSVEKIEIIILGGTWSAYTQNYQQYFILRCFEALNDFRIDQDQVPYEPSQDDLNFLDMPTLDPSETEGYNLKVSRYLKEKQGKLHVDKESATWDQIEKAHQINENAYCKLVGLVVETRPDEISESEVLRLRRLGATKIQIGLQSLDDRVLSMNERGHDLKQSKQAMFALRQAGFKIHAHWMANLYGATVESDIADFEKLFTDPAFKPDELKLYPCSLIANTPLMTHFEAGRWKPYDRESLLKLLVAIMPKAPLYCRLSRVIRDIPSTDIVVGNQETNFREVAEKTLLAQGIHLKEIRAREIKLRSINDQVIPNAYTYSTISGQNYFLSFDTADGALLGFCRLHLPFLKEISPELKGEAMIREVHVYGQSLGIGFYKEGVSQHQGLGKALIQRAKEIARKAGYHSLAVISAVGTRNYYRKLGFEDGELYQHFRF